MVLYVNLIYPVDWLLVSFAWLEKWVKWLFVVIFVFQNSENKELLVAGMSNVYHLHLVLMIGHKPKVLNKFLIGSIHSSWSNSVLTSSNKIRESF